MANSSIGDRPRLNCVSLFKTRKDGQVRAEKIEQSFARTISQLLEVSEGMFGDQKQWVFYRKVLLRRLNDLQREILNKEEVRNGYDEDEYKK